MKEIIFDLLCVGKQAKTFTLNPEVGLLKVDYSVLNIFMGKKCL